MNEWEREILRLNERLRYLEADKVPPIEARTIENAVKIGENKARIEVMSKTENMGALDKLFDTLLTKAKNPWYILAAALALFLVLFLFFPDGVIRLAEVFKGAGQ